MSDNSNVEIDEIDVMLMDDEDTTKDVSDDDLAQDALDATEDEETSTEESVEGETEDKETSEGEDEQTEEESEEETAEVDPKDAVIGDFRRQLRDSELKNARLEGELAVREEMTAKPAVVVKSPLEEAEAAYIEEYGPIPDEGIPMTSKLYQDQKAYDSQQAKPADNASSGRSTELEIATSHLTNGELSVEKMGEGLDFESVIKAGEELLTDGDVLDIQNHTAKHGKISGLKEVYKVARRRLSEAGELPTSKAKPVKKKVAVKPQKPVNKNKDDFDDLLEQEGEDYTADSESNDTKKLASFITSKC